jgi:hypothetical protein
MVGVLAAVTVVVSVIAYPTAASGSTQVRVADAPQEPSKSPTVVTTFVDQGQYVSISEWGLVCGHNERMTDAYIKGLVQKALMYRHCASSGSVRRRADMILDADGPCYSIPAGTARVLQAKFVFPRTVWRGAYAC